MQPRSIIITIETIKGYRARWKKKYCRIGLSWNYEIGEINGFGHRAVMNWLRSTDGFLGILSSEK